MGPKKKLDAVKTFISSGHLEFDVSGLLNTHLDVDVAAEENGVAIIRVASPLIPKLPFKNLATGMPNGKSDSEWNKITNLSSGEAYYYNEKTGVSQFERPAGF